MVDIFMLVSIEHFKLKCLKTAGAWLSQAAAAASPGT